MFSDTGRSALDSDVCSVHVSSEHVEGVCMWQSFLDNFVASQHSLVGSQLVGPTPEGLWN